MDSNRVVEEQLEENGYVILKDVLEAEVVAGVKNALNRYMDEVAETLLLEGRIEHTFRHELFETRFLRLFENCKDKAPLRLREGLHMPEMFGIFFHPELLDLVEGLLGPEVRLYPNYTVRPKLPNHGQGEVPWHQDAIFTAAGKHGSDPNAAGLTAEKLRMVNVWSPLVPVGPQNGCMKFIAGTHKLGLVSHHEVGLFMEIDEAHLKPLVKTAVDIILDPGDVVLFKNLLFHMGQPNASTSVRWSCDWRYQDATQSTMRAQRGHLARSGTLPMAVVRDGTQWARLSFC